MIRRAVVGLFALVTLILLLVSLLVYGLLGTAAGNRWLLNQASTVIPGELQVESWQGNLLGTVELRGIRYQNDGMSLALDHLDANLHPLELTQGWLTFEHLSLGDLVIRTTPAAENDSAPVTLPDTLTLPIGVRIERLAVNSLQLNETTLVEDLDGQSLAAWRRFQIARLDGRVLGDLQVNLNGHGQLSSPYPINSRIRWQKPLPENPRLNASQASGELLAEGPLTALQLTHDLIEPLAIHSQGQWQQVDQQWQLDLQHQWQKQALPVTGDSGLKLGAGTLNTRGPLSRIQLKGDTALHRTTPDQPTQTLAIALDSELAGQTLTIAELTLRQSEQRLTGKGTLQLQPASWDLSLNGALNTGIFSPQLPGQLTINGHTKGRLEDQRWQLEPGTLTVAGTLRRQPLTLTAKTHGNADNLQLDGDLQWGDNQLQAKGQVWPQWQLRSQLSLLDLSQLEPSLQGSLSGKVKVSGASATPQFSGTLNGEALGQGQWRIQALQANFDALGLGPQSQQLEVAASTLELDNQRPIDNLNLAIDGKLNRHRLTLSLKQGQTSLSTEAEGALSTSPGPSWQGRLRNTHLRQQHLGLWQQARPSALDLSADQQRLGDFCLQQQQSQLCLDGNLQATSQFTLEASAEALPLALLSSLLGPDYSLAGTVHGQASLTGKLQAPRGSLSIETRDAELTFNVEDGPPPLTLNTLSLQSDMDGGRAHTRLALATALGDVNADLQHGFTLDSDLGGQVSFQIEKLSAVEMLTADLRDVSGELKGDILLAGTLKTPLIDGTVALRDGNALVPAMGTAITHINLSLQGSTQGRIAVTGQALMGESPLNISGHLDPTHWPLSMSLQFSGQRLLIADRPDARVWLSPDLLLEGDLDGLMLTGKILVPEANIHPEELPEGAVTVSDDQVLVHQEGNTGQSVPLGMDVTVILGDQVRFNGFGLNATLGGTLQILQQPNKPPQLNGDLRVVEGRYRAYGQTLAISDGQLIFQGPPDNPGLDIRAYRKIPSEAITVGVQLSGTLQDPHATLYSEPGMEQSQIMSYLLTGRPLEGGNQNDANRIGQALAVYGLEKNSGVTGKIGDKLGVDEITVGNDWETEDTALMLGKQLSDRLYLTYAIGLFDAVSTVMLRYTLTHSLHLEARSSSEANSLDLIWEKELR